jgi:chorismate dehydratase
MDRKVLRIGKIPYANLFPIFFVLERDGDCSGYEFVEGMPSSLNRMLRNGDIDLSPSSSIEYIKDPSRYHIIKGHSISARGRVGSVFLFSERPIERLGGTTITVTAHSETSVALLAIITQKFYGASCAFEVSDRPLESDDPACLLIGDEAIKFNKEIQNREAASLQARGGTGTRRFYYVYDLGEIWHRRTGLPFVFALWIVREEISGTATGAEHPKRALLDKFVIDLNRAKETALRELPLIARHSPLRSFLSVEEILSYWDNLDYDFGPEHRRGLDLFATCLIEQERR